MICNVSHKVFIRDECPVYIQSLSQLVTHSKTYNVVIKHLTGYLWTCWRAGQQHHVSDLSQPKPNFKQNNAISKVSWVPCGMHRLLWHQEEQSLCGTRHMPTPLSVCCSGGIFPARCNQGVQWSRNMAFRTTLVSATLSSASLTSSHT